MRRQTSSSVLDRQQSLVSLQEETRAEVARLHREEEDLQGRVRHAQEQLAYYQTLLARLRREWGRRRGFVELVRRLG